MTPDLQHTTVLLDEAVDALLGGAGPEPAGTWVDATFGRGGHSRRILLRLGPQGRLVAFDKDPEAIHEATRITDARFSIRHEGFRHLADLPPASAAGVLMDLGVSSPQIDSPERGFSFRFDGPLDMRMDTTRGESVADWLATAEVGQIAEVIRDYGEERFAGPIAKAIVARREERGPLATTAELADLVAGAVKTREPGQNPATRTFQALRIFINAELEELQQALEASLSVQPPAGTQVIEEPLQHRQRLGEVIQQGEGPGRHEDRREVVVVAEVLEPRLAERGRKAARGAVAGAGGEHVGGAVEALHLQPGLEQRDQQPAGSDPGLQDRAFGSSQPLQIERHVGQRARRFVEIVDLGAHRPVAIGVRGVRRDRNGFGDGHVVVFRDGRIPRVAKEESVESGNARAARRIARAC